MKPGILHRIFLYLLTAISVFLSLHSQAQTDSLLRQWENVQQTPGFESDTSTVMLLNELCKSYAFTSSDSAILFGEKALSLAKEQGYVSGQAWALNTLGTAFYVNGSYEQALKAYLDSKELFEKVGNDHRVRLARNNIGLIYIAQEQFEKAAAIYLELVSNKETANDSVLQATALFNLGLSYDFLGKYDLALEKLNQSLAISSEKNLHRLKSMALNRMGEVYFHKEEFEKAKSFYREVIQDTLGTNNWELAFAHTGLAQTFLAAKDFDKATEHGMLGFEFAKKVKAKWDIARVLGIIAKAHAEEGDFEKAYNYKFLEAQYKDSIQLEAREKELNFLHLQQKETENLALARENEINLQKIRTNKLVNIGIGLLFIFISVLAFFSYNNNKMKSSLNKKLLSKNSDVARQNILISKQKKELESLNSTKDKLFSIISHDLKSPLSTILGTLDLIKRGVLSDQEQRDIFKKLHYRVYIINQMLNNLLHWANAQQLGIRIRRTHFDLTKTVEQTLSIARILAEDKNITLKHEYHGPKIIIADEDHIKIILQNLIGNAIKFTPENGKVYIEYSETDDYILIHIKDTGIGMSEEKIREVFSLTGTEITVNGTKQESGTGIGLMLAREFIKKNGGHFDIESAKGKGTVINVSFEKPDRENIDPGT